MIQRIALIVAVVTVMASTMMAKLVYAATLQAEQQQRNDAAIRADIDRIHSAEHQFAEDINGIFNQISTPR